jgi:hypothetical protein
VKATSTCESSVGNGIVPADMSPLRAIGILLRQLTCDGKRHYAANAPVLNADDGLATDTAVAKFLNHLPRFFESGGGADARGDNAVLEHARNLI